MSDNMVNKQELLNELDEKFKAIKKKLKLKYGLEDFDKIFLIKDMSLQQGFVNERLSRAICGRIVNAYESWANYIHNILMPPPGSLIYMSENQAFTKQEKDDLMTLMTKILAFTTINPWIGQTSDEKAESKFMNDSIRLWHEFFSPKFAELSAKINRYWTEKSAKA